MTDNVKPPVLLDASTSDTGETDGVKLFVGQIPRGFGEAQIRPLFEPFGTVLSVNPITDKVTGEHRGCAFVRMASKPQADAVIAGLHNQKILPSLSNPVQVKFADGEAEKFESKLFIGMLPKNITDMEVAAILSQYGSVLEAIVLKDINGTSKGCAFVKMASRQQAESAIQNLNGLKRVEGAPGPIVVKYADTQRDKMQKRSPMMSGGGHMGNMGHMGLGGIGGLPNMGNMGNTFNMYRQSPAAVPQMQQTQSAQQQQWPGMAGGYPLGGMGMGVGMGGLGGMGGMGGMGMPNPQGASTGTDGCNLFIYHLPPEFTDPDLAVAFSTFGNVISAKVFLDKMTNMSKGFGFVSYDNPTSAAAAIQAMDGFQIGMKRLKVQLKKPRGSPY